MRKVILAILVMMGILTVAETSHALTDNEVTFYVIDESERETAIDECFALNEFPDTHANMVGGNCEVSSTPEMMDNIYASSFSDFWSFANIGTPAMLCSQDAGMWRVYGNLVIALEGCTMFDEDISPPDTMVLFLENYGNPADRCDRMGGRYEFIGHPLYFNLKICWDVDY